MLTVDLLSNLLKSILNLLFAKGAKMLYNVYIRHNDGSLQSFTNLTEKRAKELKKRFRRAFMALLIDAIEITDENHQVVYSIQVSRR